MQRNNTFDIAKFWAIVSVIFAHVINRYFYNQIFLSFIETYFLSLFFFVSGLLTKEYKKRGNDWLRKQAVHLLIPFFSFLLLDRALSMILQGTSFFTADSFDDSKSGFWFLFTLFSFVFSLFLLEKFINKSKIDSIYVKGIILFSPFCVVSFLCYILPYEISGYFSLMSFRRYWLFYIYGYSISCLLFGSNILNIFEMRIINRMSILVYLFSMMMYVVFVKDIKTNFDFFVWFVANISGCHFWLYLIKQFEQKFSNKYILKIGQNTLGIYLLHYYPLKMGVLIYDKNQLLMNNCNIFNSVFFASTILVVSLLLTNVFRLNKVTALLFLGIYPNNLKDK